jgi:hypothetical protein
MKIAILYTGALRTIRDTMHYLKKNVLEAASRAGHSVEVFAVLQSNDLLHYRESNWSHMPFPPTVPSTVEDSKITEEWLHEQLTGHLQTLTWFRPNDSLWIKLREHLLANMNLPPHTATYLRNSGSLIEYYQMYLAYTNLLQHERTLNMTYDYVIRLRPDVIIAHPLTFSWLTWTVEDIQERFLEIQKATGTADTYGASNFLRFMNTLYRPTVDSVMDKDMYSLPRDTGNNFTLYRPTENSAALPQNHGDLFDWQAPNLGTQIQKYLQTGPYAVTLRGNVVYMLPRQYMGSLAVLGTSYGLYANPNTYTSWWDAENQFQGICLAQRLVIFDCCAQMECDSLYQYDQARYYDENGNVKNEPRVFFFLKRH